MSGSGLRSATVWLARAIAYLLYGYLMLVQIILVQGFFLLLFGANTGSAYVDWAYRSLERVMAPFRGMFEPIPINGNAVLDTSVIFAMIIYGIVILLLRSLLDWLTYRLDLIDSDRARQESEAIANEAFAATSAPAGTPASTYPAAAYPDTAGTESLPSDPPPSDPNL